jgi:hypothetical protein
MDKINNLKKGFGELTLEEKFNFLNEVGASFSSNSCEFCGERIITNYNFKVRLIYGQRTMDNKILCKDCISKVFKVEKYKLEFYGFTENFRKQRNINSYGIWEKGQVIDFIKEIKKNKIVVDHERTICADFKYHESKEYKLQDLIKIYKIDEKIINGQ